jgi:predicted dehydrogenase
MQYYGIPWHGRWAHGFGGPTTQLGIHAMDVFLWLLGDWVEVTAEVATLDHDMEVEDVSLALVRFASGALGNIVNSAVSPRQETHIRFDFQRATAEVTALYRYGNEDWRLTPAPGPAGEALPEGWDRVPHDERSSHESQLRQLLECWARGERPLVSGDEVRRTIEFVTCLYKAAFTRQAVRRGSVVPGDAYYTRLYGPDPQPYRPFAET